MADPSVFSPPRQIIRDMQLVDDTWLHVADDAPLPEHGDLTVSIARLGHEQQRLLAREGKLGLRMGVDQDPADAALALLHPDKITLIVIEITKFSDGRHFSLARLLRQRLGFTGELRASGDVLPDQLVYMKRCGFNAFALRSDKRPDTALRLLSSFSLSYQGSGNTPMPLYRRRLVPR